MGRNALRWILLTSITACGEHDYTVTFGGDRNPARDGTEPNAGAPTNDAVDIAPPTESRPTDAPLIEVMSPCPAGSCGAAALAFFPNDPYRQRRVIRGDTSRAENARSRANCAGLGPDQTYELDLRAFSGPVSAYLHVRAGFDVSLAIETGRQDDPFLVACNEDHAPGAEDAFIAATLEPKLYRVVVDAERGDSSGAFELVVELASPTGRCGAPPPNDRCNEAIVIDPDRPAQTFFGTTQCASDQAHANWECGAYFADRPVEVFYSIDLSGRTQPALLHATTQIAPTNHDTVLFVTRDVLGECAEPLICGDDDSRSVQAELWANLEPGFYFLGVESYEGYGDFGLSVEISAASCVPANDTCQAAQVIDPKLGAQTLRAWPGCGDDTLTTNCNALAPSPDIFYRLDLREFEGKVRVRANAVRGDVAFDKLLLMADGGGTCGNELSCGNFDLWLAPDSYYLALDGFRDQHGPVDLTLEIETGAPPPVADCIDERVATCARAENVDCCSGNDAECWLIFTSCGLRPEALSCLCAADPDCCGGRNTSYQCRRLLEECGTFCAGFDRVLTCPGDD